VKIFRTTQLRKGLLAPTEIRRWVLAAYVQNLPQDWPIAGELQVGDPGFLARIQVSRANFDYVFFEWAEQNPDGRWTLDRWPVPRNLPSESFRF
jgi:hypothetical protein